MTILQVLDEYAKDPGEFVQVRKEFLQTAAAMIRETTVLSKQGVLVPADDVRAATDQTTPAGMAIIREALDIALGQIAALWDQLEHRDRIAADAVAAERDACAQECDALASIEGIAQRCAAAIRSRGAD